MFEFSTLDSTWWNDPRPLEIDLGCARGHFLLAAAALYPDRRFLGIEWQIERARQTRRKILNQSLQNVRVVRAEIRHALALHLPPNCACRIHVLFPDPWPKRRHAPRRLINPGIFTLFARVLIPDGTIRFLTDDEPYYLHSLKILNAEPSWRILPEDPVGDWPPTEFQTRFLQLGKPIYGWIARQVPAVH
ncbi:MAG: hypothetical protein N2035_00930 [Chthoniobacterales bacterium]|nr:hypothetical protein [Chthoniobacterales bacterium]MCX7712223.1 hypothetical protein [Chthoniobacterales bacterium]